MTSRQRVKKAINHEIPDRVPLDLGATMVTGMSASSVHKLRVALGLDTPGTPVRVSEPYQMLGEIAPDLQQALGVDCIGLESTTNFFGYENSDWKPWKLNDGTPVLVPGRFNTRLEVNGDLLMYPQGDTTASPCARMPSGGFYFDAIIRQQAIDEATLSVSDNMEEFQPITDEQLKYYEKRADYLWQKTDKAIIGSFGGASIGDIAFVPGMALKTPRGIRDVEEWYVSLLTRPDFIKGLFHRQCQVALQNLERIHQAVQEKIDIIFVSGTDFGAQDAPFISVNLYRNMFKPFHKQVNDWIHQNTTWKTFMHSCGCVEPLINDFIEAGFDILNPVQISASDKMNPQYLKQTYGKRIVFWGGGVNTQHTLPFGTAGEVAKEVESLVDTFKKDGGYVFAGVHNIQSSIPVENIVTLFETFNEYR